MISIKVVLFATLRESLGEEGAVLSIARDSSIAELIDKLVKEKGPNWGISLRDEVMLIAVDHTVVAADHVLTQDCEVAFFPPVTGG